MRRNFARMLGGGRLFQIFFSRTSHFSGERGRMHWVLGWVGKLCECHGVSWVSLHGMALLKDKKKYALGSRLQTEIFWDLDADTH